MTVRVSYNHPSPNTRFELECDVVETQASWGSHGRRRYRVYINAYNRGNTSSFFNNRGTHRAIFSRTASASTTRQPFLQSGVPHDALRWRIGPIDHWATADSDGEFSGRRAGSNNVFVEMLIEAGGSFGGLVRRSGQAPWSRIARAPGTPSSLSASSITPTSVRLSAGAAARGNGAIQEYQFSVMRGSTEDAMSRGSTSRARTMTGLRPNTSYTARVRARNRDGWGPWRTTSFRTPVGTPGTPSLSPLTSSSSSSLRAEWSAASTGGASSVEYQLQIAENSGFTANLQTLSQVGRTRTVTGLSGGTRYYARVRAVNSFGPGPWSSTRNILLDELPPQPSRPVVTPSSLGTYAAVSWDQVPPFNGSPVTAYELRYRPDGGTYTYLNAGLTGSVDVGGLTPGIRYSWSVRAINASGPGPWSTSTLVAQPSAPPPPSGESLFFDGTSGENPDLGYFWSAATNNSPSMAIGRDVTGWGGQLGAYSSSEVALFGNRSMAVAVKYLSENGQMIYDLVSPEVAVESASDIVGSFWIYAPKKSQVDFRFETGRGSSWDSVADVTGSPNEWATVSANEWTRVEHRVRVGTGVTRIRVRTHFSDYDEPLEPSDVFYIDGAMVTLGTALYPYFDGSTPDTAEFEYLWIGATHASESERVRVVGYVPEDPLLDPNCPPVPRPPRAPLVDDSCVADESDALRRTWIRVREEDVAEWFVSLPTYVLRTTAPIHQLRISAFRNDLGVDPNMLTDEDRVSDQMISYIPADTVLTLDGMAGRAYAAVGGAEAIPADHLIYGAGGLPPTWPEFRCGVEYDIAIDTSLDLPLGALAPVEVLLARRVR